MAVLGSIVLGLEARTEKLDRGLKKGEGLLKSFAGRVGGAASSLAGFATGAVGAGAAALAVVAGLAHLAVGAGRTVLEMGKVADRLGTTTAKFMEMDHAVKATRGDAEALGPAIEHLKVNLADAATQGGPVRDAIERIGLSAKALDRLDPADAFAKVAGGLAKIKDQGERANLSLRLLGPSAAGLTKTLAAGGGAVASAAEDFRGFGASIDEAGRGKIDRAFAAFERVTVAVQGFGTTLAAHFAPAAEAVGNAIAFLIGQVTSLTDWLLKADAVILDGFFGSPGPAVDALDAVRAKADQTAESIERVGAAVTVAAARFQEGAALFARTRTPLEKYRMDLERIDALLKSRSIDGETARRAKVQAGIASGQNEAKFSGALTLRSTEARTAILQANARDRFVLGDMQKATAATAAYTRESAISLRTLVQRATTQQHPS